MSGLQITITTAGKAAIVNAENTGTAPVRIARIGVTAQAFAPNAGMLALPGEIKRLDTFAGEAVADDTLHLTIRDDSADAYSLRGFGLYLSDGTLFAVYGQATVILEKSPLAMMLLATDVRFVEITATSLEFGDTTWINPPATVNTPGVVELADNAETTTGTDGTRAVTPAGLKAAIDDRFGAGAPTAFVKGLLALATAAAMRTALAIKGAALKDEGEGNGLDADKLDGQHGAYYLDYANLTGKPNSLPPSAHTHQWSDIVNPPATATRWADWGEITGKPIAFVPVAHVHSAADITSGVLAVERIPALPISQTSGLQTALDAKVAKAGDSMTGTLVSGTSSGELRVGGQGAGQVSVVFKYDGTMAIATAGVAGAFRTIWNSGNFDPATKAPLNNPQFTGTGVKVGAGNGGECNIAFGVDDWYLYSNSGNYGLFSSSKGSGFAFDKAAKTLSVNGNNVWTSGNFNPATKANLTGAAFTGDISAPGISSGKIRLVNGENGRTGYLGWYMDSGVRAGYLGYGAGTTLIWNLENGYSTVDFNAAFIARGGFDTGSSRKLKDIDGPMPYGLAEVRRIATLIGRYKPDYNPDGRLRLFFDAEQFFEVMPEVVEPEGVEHNGEKVPTIKLDQVMPPAYRAIAELADLVDELRAEITALKAGR